MKNIALNSKQQEAIEHKNGPLLIAAGAGSGKTRTLTQRLMYLINSGVAPENIIAITFTNKAANEMRSRVANGKWQMANSNLPFIGTFHSLGARILKAETKYLNRNSNYAIYDDDDSMSLVKKITKEMNLSKDQFNPTVIQAVIGKTKNELRNEPSGKVYSFVFKKYEEALAENNAFDFDDLIQKVVVLFHDYPEVLKKYQALWQHILVDEFQDVNTSQYEMIKLLAQKHQNLAVVGDDFQSIFAFRGADFRNFLNFEKDWPKAKVILLEENYRSTETILKAANGVIKNNKLQKPKTLWTKNNDGGAVKVIASSHDNDEAEWVVQKILELMRAGDALNKMAIIYRTNAQSRAIEQNLISAGLPYKIFGGIRFYDRKEIKDIVAALRLANNPKDSVSAERLMKNLPKKSARQLVEDLPRLGKEYNILELINHFLNETEYFEYLEKHQKNPEERIENINELIVFAGTHSSLSAFLEQIALASSADLPAEALAKEGGLSSAVNLMTIHIAKGLEFQSVFVIGCDEGTLPHHRSYEERGGLEEERRLMYVAMTRAEKNLFLSFNKMASRFLYEIPPELVEFIQLKSQRKDYLDEEEEWIDYE
ncbi:MAG: UvrD-helicase domain-containing protein [Patescibacteria group bacterium]|mgnify:CR=1 FL=1